MKGHFKIFFIPKMISHFTLIFKRLFSVKNAFKIKMIFFSHFFRQTKRTLGKKVLSDRANSKIYLKDIYFGARPTTANIFALNVARRQPSKTLKQVSAVSTSSVSASAAATTLETPGSNCLDKIEIAN